MKMAHCKYCGKEIGLQDRLWGDESCGDTVCERFIRAQQQSEREESHEQLDRDLGYYH